MKKKLTKILVLELIIVSLLFFAIINNEFKLTNIIKEIFKDYTKEEVNTNIDYDANNIDNIVENIFKSEEKEKDSIYETIKKGLLEGKTSIKVDENLLGENRDNFFDIVEDVLLDNPEIMYYTSGKYSNGIFTPKYSKPIEEKQVHQKIIKEKRDEIIPKIIDNNMSHYEKVKTIHDFIINNTQYDTRHFNGEKIPSESYTVYGVLIKGKAVCEGYAKTMKYFLDYLDIESMIVVGSANGENHAWNIVNIDGDYYHIDATWDDPVTDDGTDTIIYDYFNLKDKDIEKTHNWNRDKYPICNSDKYNYYYYNELIVFNYTEFYNKVKSALLNNKNEISLKILDYDEKTYNIPSTINNIVINNSNKITINKYAYSINTNQNIVKIYFLK